MTTDEQIDLMRREIADLRDRVRQLEARPQLAPTYLPIPLQPPPQVPWTPYQPWQPPVISTCNGGNPGEILL